MAYLGYKSAAYRKWKREQEEIKKLKEAEKANQRTNLLKSIAIHILIAIVLITIYYLLWNSPFQTQKTDFSACLCRFNLRRH